MNQSDYLSNIIAGAQKLCSQQANAEMNTIARENRPTSKGMVDPEITRGYGQPSSSQDDAWDRMFLSEAAYQDSSAVGAPRETMEAPISQEAVSKSRLPDFIKQSMVNEVIDTKALNPNPLDTVDLSHLQKPKRPAPAQIREQTAPQQTIVNTSIDYPLIRTIVNECIENKLKQLLSEDTLKALLSENTLKTIHLSGGQIRLVDNSGNVYGAKLEKQGNISNKK